ncbi:MAG: hypothetical protein HYZ40_08200 [Rhodospirillales bacterium]|nr:hypothetical protein [Rhodospirillales bacterium]
MKLSRQTLTYIAWAAAQVGVLAAVAWFADRQMKLGYTDSAGWRPFTWPFSAEDAPPGKAYSGDEHDIYVWLKLGHLKPGQKGDCPEGIATDEALERAVDVRLLDPRFVPVGPGERVRVTDVFGRTRVYVHKRHNGALRYAEAVAIPYNCDLVTAIIDGDARDPAKRKLAREFLESNTVQVGVIKALEER